MTNFRALTDAELRERFSALIRKKYPYQPDKKRKERVVRLSPDEETELWECAIEENRRESIRIQQRWKPKQLELWGVK